MKMLIVKLLYQLYGGFSICLFTYKVYGIVIKDQLPPGDNISHKSP